MSTVIIARTKKKVPNFFGPNPATPTLAKYQPVHWALYVDNFIKPCDQRYMNVKIGTGPFFRKKTANEKDMPLRAFQTYLERQLDPGHHDLRRSRKGKGPLTDHVVLGCYGGRHTEHVLADIDNHDSLGEIKEDGKYVKLADLDLPYLSLLKRAYDLPLKPHVIMTSSRSLGVYMWYQLTDRMLTNDANDLLKDVYNQGGLPQVEIFPQPPAEYHPAGRGPTCHRRPFGLGCYTITETGILRPWRRQMSHYLRPGQLPAFGQLVDSLIDLWQEQVADYRRMAVEPRLIAHVDAQVSKIRRWMSEGCPQVNEVTPDKVVVKASKLKVAECNLAVSPLVGSMPEAWKAMPIQVRVFRLASEGLPLKGSLNWTLYQLAKHLVCVELRDRPDRAEIAHHVLSRYCLERHNGRSSRLDGRDVPREVESIIARTLVKAEALRPSMPPRTYRFPLRIRWIICNQGEVNAYALEGSSVFPPSLSRDHFTVPPLEGGVKEDLSAYRGRMMRQIREGHYDDPLPQAMQDKITAIGKKSNALPFVTRVANYLKEHDGKARISRQLLELFYQGNSHKQIEKYRTIGITSGVFYKSKGYRSKKLSTEYTLRTSPESTTTSSPET